MTLTLTLLFEMYAKSFRSCDLNTSSYIWPPKLLNIGRGEGGIEGRYESLERPRTSLNPGRETLKPIFLYLKYRFYQIQLLILINYFIYYAVLTLKLIPSIFQNYHLY